MSTCTPRFKTAFKLVNAALRIDSLVIMLWSGSMYISWEKGSFTDIIQTKESLY